MRVYIKENSWLAAIAAKKLGSRRLAMVVGNRIFLHRVSREKFLSDPYWVCHEIEHVMQFARHGFAWFIVLYTIESIPRGYYQNKFEAQARSRECDHSLLQKVKFV